MKHNKAKPLHAALAEIHSISSLEKVEASFDVLTRFLNLLLLCFLSQHVDLSVFPAGPSSGSTNNANITVALLLLKSAVDPNATLSSWIYNTDYCTWQGIQCDGGGLPTAL